MLAPRLPDPLPRVSSRQPRPLPPLRRSLAVRAQGAQLGQLPPPPTPRCAPGAAAASLAFASLVSGEGTRIGLLGDTGSGKSHAARILAEYYLRQSRGLVLVADSKGDGGWPGDVRESIADLAERPPTGRQIVLTPDPFGEPLDLESVARWQWALASRRCPSLVVYDELADACADGEWLPGTRDLPRVFTHGRRVQISAVWGGQFAQQIPREAYECSSCLFVWRQAGNALAILRRRGYTDEAAEHAILALPGDAVPPAERGAFVVLRRGRPWDRQIYRF